MMSRMYLICLKTLRVQCLACLFIAKFHSGANIANLARGGPLDPLQSASVLQCELTSSKQAKRWVHAHSSLRYKQPRRWTDRRGRRVLRMPPAPVVMKRTDALDMAHNEGVAEADERAMYSCKQPQTRDVLASHTASHKHHR